MKCKLLTNVYLHIHQQIKILDVKSKKTCRVESTCNQIRCKHFAMLMAVSASTSCHLECFSLSGRLYSCAQCGNASLTSFLYSLKRSMAHKKGDLVLYNRHSSAIIRQSLSAAAAQSQHALPCTRTRQCGCHESDVGRPPVTHSTPPPKPHTRFLFFELTETKTRSE